MASVRTVLAAGFVVAGGCLFAAVSLLGGEAHPDPGPGRTPDERLPERNLPSLIAPTRPSTYTVWAGPGCETDTTYREQGRVENGDAAWYTVPSGGFRGGGCDGRFTALPMSGSRDRDGTGTATWTWPVGDDYERCALAVFVPKGPRDIDVAGNPTVYRVLADPDDPTSTYAAFGVRQPVHRGTLVQVGTYPVKSPTFTVHLTDRGLDWGTSTLTGAHHAAAQLRLTCRA
ncbi:adhesin [Streptomyces sp. WAC05374]|uniref:adhesin n=1 Tax=Streptomyces sp. WAC05374 TaxID=2487420 RepID=UPI000F89BA8D|nr:adhesin [Streptomyces sp. WAC05374]RST11123.1 adhesin [Streptomyces sp. WAC05374]TDF47124.1 adhesin [Streptomyces sp. WAC05374]TDF57382.1 adhesin [Streptomyces sp. WAC05374]TDF61487.1 adhesin [Streptomyces sp. WAC05374]